MKKGKIILIEGTDKSGKETQTKLLFDRLNKEGQCCQLISFPRYDRTFGSLRSKSDISEEIYSHLQKTLFSSFNKV